MQKLQASAPNENLAQALPAWLSATDGSRARILFYRFCPCCARRKVFLQLLS